MAILAVAIHRRVASGYLSEAAGFFPALVLPAAVKSLTTVDFEDMLPPEGGNYAGDANAATFLQTVIGRVDEPAPTGVTLVKDLFVGPTAQEHTFDGPGYEKL